MTVPDAAARDRLRAAFDPQLLEQACHRFVAELSSYFSASRTNSEPVLDWVPPPKLVEEAGSYLRAAETGAPYSAEPAALADRFGQLASAFLARSIRLHSPRTMGHQVPPSAPIAGLFDALGSTSNQAMGVYEMGEFSTAAERAIGERLAEYLGWPTGEFAVIGTHGGSLANLTALLSARNVRYPDAWMGGIAAASGKGQPAIIVNADAHYCVARAAGVLGIGVEHVLRAPADSRRRTDPQKLEKMLDEAVGMGIDVFALVASACATPIGAFDPLDELADIAARRNLWFHVDGAHGASALVSRRHRHLVKGLERADSFVWDAHKMMLVPSLFTMVFYRKREHSYATFQQDAPYLFDPSAPGLAEFDSAVRTFECTKRSMALGLWGLWSLFGPRLFEDYIDVTFDLGKEFHSLLKEQPDFEVLHEPECNILCFRHLPPKLAGADSERISQFQQLLRRRLVEDGRFYTSSTKIDGVYAIRVALMNPFADRTHFLDLCNTLRKLGEEIP